jgi:hypothetical protein
MLARLCAVKDPTCLWLYRHRPLGASKGFLENRILQGQPLTSELVAILMVYFVQGILGLARLAVSFFLKSVGWISEA